MSRIRAATLCYAFCGILACLVVVIGGFTIAYAPAYPEMNVCNQELDWGSIVQGMSSLKVKADYEVTKLDAFCILHMYLNGWYRSLSVYIIQTEQASLCTRRKGYLVIPAQQLVASS